LRLISRSPPAPSAPDAGPGAGPRACCRRAERAGGRDPACPRRAAGQAAAGGGSLLATALASYLAAGHSGAVYEQPAAFIAFIQGGGNVPRYDSGAVRSAWEQRAPAWREQLEAAGYTDAAVRPLHGY
jgi:hypothetical protein